MEDKVNILLATRNGDRFLSEQLRSIDAQTVSAARITVRDDESTDSTVAQIEKWAQGRTNVTLFRGPQLGAFNNFFTLLKNADENCKYFAFCDQDDVWMPEKLERAIATIKRCGTGHPVLYCSRVEYVNEKLEHLGYSRIPRSPALANALVENIATGCTLVLNRRARALICERLPRFVLMHDWWSYLVISAFGKVIHDPWPSVKYRQHGHNVAGGTSSLLVLFKRRIRRFLKRPIGARFPSDQAREFQRCFGDLLSPQHTRILERFLTVRGDLWTRMSYGAAMEVWRQSRLDTVILGTLILMGRV